MEVIQIVPQLPPAINGLGDYALNLARKLRTEYNLLTQFVVCNPRSDKKAELEGFPILRLDECSADNLKSVLTKQTAHSLLLHYVGYGYAKRGYPTWLINGLQQWRQSNQQGQLVTMFHEIYASSYRPWTSSFWLGPFQKVLARRLTQLSDCCFTNRQEYAKLLTSFEEKAKKKTIILPVFSTVGEPQEITCLGERTKQIVLFGHPNSRIKTFQIYGEILHQICVSLGVKQIIDIGIPTGLRLSSLGKIPIIETGVQNESEISKILQNSMAGFITYPPPEQFAKSTIFAAYCAHGLVSFTLSERAKLMDELEPGKHYWIASKDMKEVDLQDAQKIASSAYSWYQRHNLSIQARIYARHLGNRLDNRVSI